MNFIDLYETFCQSLPKYRLCVRFLVLSFRKSCGSEGVAPKVGGQHSIADWTDIEFMNFSAFIWHCVIVALVQIIE